MIPLEPILEKYGIEYRPERNNQAVLCPFHDDSHPSLSINLENGLFHCFACGAQGSPIDFVMSMEGIGFADAKRKAEGIADQVSTGGFAESGRNRGGLLPVRSGRIGVPWKSPWKR